MRAQVHGAVDPGYESVLDAFRTNFDEGNEVGASFAAVRNGRCVVDLWAGRTDKQGRPWERETIQLIFSGTKGLVALCMIVLMDGGALDPNSRVNRYWPEFGKPNVLVRDVLSHRARLPGVDKPLTLEMVVDDEEMARILAGQGISTDPRAEFCYHALTFGWLCGELVRRITGCSIGKFFRKYIAEPLKLDIWIGLPWDQEQRVADLELAPEWATFEPFLHRRALSEDAFIRSIWGNPEGIFAREGFPWNRRELRGGEIPGANAVGSARAVAMLYSHLANGGKPLVKESTLRLATQTWSDGFDVVSGERRRFGAGFQLQTELASLGRPSDAFGHGGAGGSIHGAWPKYGLGFSYAMNLMRSGPIAVSRTTRLLETLFSSVSAPEGGDSA